MLTHIKITSARPAAKTCLLRDTQGLYLAVQPTGSKLWRLNYRYLDKQKTLHLGRWPEIGLAAARARRDEARKQIAEGIDPAIEKKRAKIAARYAAANTFSAVAEEWLLKCEREGRAAVMGATLLNECGKWHADAIERQRAYVDTNQVRRIYARGEYWDERVHMMQYWSDYLDTLRDGGKVLQGSFGKDGTSG